MTTTNIQAMTDDHDLTDEQLAKLQEMSDILCAANHSLKTLSGLIDVYIHLKGEEDGYTYCDQSGDFYCLRKALKLLEDFIRVNGLIMDPVR